MTTTRDTIEITNKTSESNETLNEIMRIFFYIDWRIVLLVAWVLTSALSIYETLKHCEQGLIYVLLSLVPFVNVFLYFTIKRICRPRRNENYTAQVVNRSMNRSMNRSVSNKNLVNRPRNGIGLRSVNVYPSPVYQNKN